MVQACVCVRLALLEKPWLGGGTLSFSLFSLLLFVDHFTRNSELLAIRNFSPLQACVGVRLALPEEPRLGDGPLLVALATHHLARVLRTASSQQALDAATFAIQASAGAG